MLPEYRRKQHLHRRIDIRIVATIPGVLYSKQTLAKQIVSDYTDTNPLDDIHRQAHPSNLVANDLEISSHTPDVMKVDSKSMMKVEGRIYWREKQDRGAFEAVCGSAFAPGGLQVASNR